MRLNSSPLPYVFHLLVFHSLPRQLFCASLFLFPGWNVPSWVAQRSAWCFTPWTVVQGLVALLELVVANSSRNPAAVPGHGTPYCCQPVLPTSAPAPVPLHLLHLPAAAFQPAFPLPHNSKPFFSPTTMVPLLKRGIQPRSLRCHPRLSELARVTATCPSYTTSSGGKAGHTHPTHAVTYKNSPSAKQISVPSTLKSIAWHIVPQHLLATLHSAYTLFVRVWEHRAACKTARGTRQSRLAGFWLLSLNALHCWAKNTFYRCSTASTGGCPHWVGKSLSCIYKKKKG